MNTKFSAISLATFAGALALAMPAVSHAGNVGYYNMCSGSGPDAAHIAAITTAGHDPVLVTTPDAGSLNSLDALSVTNCSTSGYTSDWTDNLAAITAAVDGGMVLIMHDRAVTGAGAVLPGGAALNTVNTLTPDEYGNEDIDFPFDSPLRKGSGGTLDENSLDNGGFSSHGYVTNDSLPAGGFSLAVRPALGGGEGNFTSCEDEGFRGTKLNWCRQICEIEQRPGVLDTWIHRWINRYHTDPPCAGEASEDSDEGATVWYAFGAGEVIYSTIPLDFYLSGNGGSQVRNNMTMIYLPNVIGWVVPGEEDL